MKNIIIIGGGVAGTVTAKELAKRNSGVNIIVVDPKDYMEVPFGQLRTLVDPEGFGPITRKNYADFFSGVTFVKARADRLEKEKVVLDNGDSLDYDYLVVATGSSFPAWPYLKGAQPTLEKRHQAAVAEHGRIKAANTILIVGGGVIGVELAGEILHRYPDKKVRILEGGPSILGSLSAKMTNRAGSILKSMGVEIETGKRFSDGDETKYGADLVIKAVGISLNTGWISGGLDIPMNEQAAIEVDDHFRIKGHHNIFAVGDITNVPELKQGAFARMHGTLTAKNLTALLKNPSAKLKAYKPQKTMAMVTIGPKAGAAQLPMGHLHFLTGIKQKDLLSGMFLKK